MARRHTKTFLHVFRHSLIPYDNYYADILHKTRFLFSLKYFIVLSVFLVVVELLGAFIGLTKSYPFLRTESGVKAIINQIPHDLVVTLHNGKLMTNYDRPVIIFNPDNTTPGTLVVIDQKADKNKIREYEARYLFTENELITNMNGQVMSFEYSSKDFNGEPLAIPLGNIAKNPPTLISSIYLGIVLLLPLAITFFRIVLLALISGIVFVICFKLIPHLKFGKVFQISLHAATAAIVIQTVVSAFRLIIPLSFWWFNMMITIFLLAALYEAYVIAEKHSDSIKTSRSHK